MTRKVKIALCMGSSCFARGNNTLVAVLEDLVEARGWRDRVELSGLRCENHCMDGPVIRVDGDLHTGMDEGALLDILEKKLGTGDGAAARASVRLSSVRRTSRGEGS